MKYNVAAYRKRQPPTAIVQLESLHIAPHDAKYVLRHSYAHTNYLFSRMLLRNVTFVVKFFYNGVI